MFILVADDKALSGARIRHLLEGSGGVAKMFGFQQTFGITPHSLTYTIRALQLLKETIMRRKRQFMV
jgi:hypothetical protein